MKNQSIISVAVTDGVYQGYMYAVADLELPLDEFVERYLKPAYQQALREMSRTAKESV
jgi:hypothetical protein